MSTRTVLQPSRHRIVSMNHDGDRLCKRLRDRTTPMSMDAARRYLQIGIDELRDLILRDTRLELEVRALDKPGGGRWVHLTTDAR